MEALAWPEGGTTDYILYRISSLWGCRPKRTSSLLTQPLALFRPAVGTLFRVEGFEDALGAFGAFSARRLGALVDGLLGFAFEDLASAVVLPRLHLLARTALEGCGRRSRRTRLRDAKLLHEASLLLTRGAFPRTRHASLRRGEMKGRGND